MPPATAPAHKAIVQALMTVDEDQTLVIQSGNPVGLLRTLGRLVSGQVWRRHDGRKWIY
jgi:hypothetical protein